ncbi:MAG TPA: glycoside hydrolase domain-containing protein [Acidimicrobiales bacterium]|nr:glycoside hydrolase domain-containing protein [Acidimicrobiales bacterium]
MRLRVVAMVAGIGIAAPITLAIFHPGPDRAQVHRPAQPSAASQKPHRTATVVASVTRGARHPKHEMFHPASHAATARPAHARPATRLARHRGQTAMWMAAHRTAAIRAADRRRVAIAHRRPAHFWGEAFDLCAAPSVGAVRDMGAVGFGSVNIYIGGVNRGCSQPRLTRWWARLVTRMGWGLIPTYVGLQAPYSSCGSCRQMAPPIARSEGTAAARDAAWRARLLGIGPGNPIYFDMEQYQAGAGSSPAVMRFLGAWTSELHHLGYLSGVYGGVSSGIGDLVARYGSGFPEPDDIWFADWNGHASTSEGGIPWGDWFHCRIDQYLGGHDVTIDGVTLNLDSDLVDAAVVRTIS